MVQMSLPKASPRIFLDVDDLEDLSEIERHVANSTVVLLFLSKGYFHSRACLQEVRTCQTHGKRLILVLERNPMHGGSTLDEHFNACPEDLRTYVFGGSIGAQKAEVITWQRNPSEFHLTCILRIAEALINECKLDRASEQQSLLQSRKTEQQQHLAARSTIVRPTLKTSFKSMKHVVTNSPAGSAMTPTRQTLYVPNGLADARMPLSGDVTVLVSYAHPAAQGLANYLAQRKC